LGPKRKVALLVAYNGSAYQGLQRNTNAKTIEDVLEAAMHAAGAISDDNVGTLQKIAWSKAGRTDKGVHAAGQVISCKLILQAAGGGAGSYGEGLGDGGDEQAALAGTMAAINAHLERACSDVRVLRLERVTNSFCAHTGCSSREYEYLLPAYCLRPPHATVLGEEGAAGAHDPALAASEPPSSESASVAAQGQAASAEHPSPLGRGDSDPLDATELARVNAALGMLEGTHYFHNFTDVRGLSGAKDKCAAPAPHASRPCLSQAPVPPLPLTPSSRSPLTGQRSGSSSPRARGRSAAWGVWRTCLCCTTASPSCCTRYAR
jgi:tRNA pseudouridine38-40 synthase